MEMQEVLPEAAKEKTLPMRDIKFQAKLEKKIFSLTDYEEETAYIFVKEDSYERINPSWEHMKSFFQEWKNQWLSGELK